jgi:hypothetical protein
MAAPPPFSNHSARLERGDVGSLQALGAAGDFEFNRLAFVQRFVPVRRDGGKVHENIFAGLALDESETLRCVEPLHCSLFFQCNSLFCLSYLELFPAFRQQKRPASVTCRPDVNPKGLTRATNAFAVYHIRPVAGPGKSPSPSATFKPQRPLKSESAGRQRTLKRTAGPSPRPILYLGTILFASPSWLHEPPRVCFPGEDDGRNETIFATRAPAANRR